MGRSARIGQRLYCVRLSRLVKRVRIDKLAALYSKRATQGLNGARELRQKAVPGGLGQAIGTARLAHAADD